MRAKAVHRTLDKIHLELDPYEAKFIKSLLGTQMAHHIKYSKSTEYRYAQELYEGINEALEELG